MIGEVVGLAAGSSVKELCVQANRYRPTAIALADAADEVVINGHLDYAPRIFTGEGSLLSLVDQVEADCVVCAVVGTGALAATIRAVELGRRVALANKEALVVAGSIIMPLAERTGATILPIDSEHSGVFQALQAGRRSDVRTIYLTASGGPFRTWSQEQMDHITLEDALQHPTWDMGPKITIDSATMMNKALEIVEAHWIFGLQADQIRVVVHPESIVHSLVEFCDGSLTAQLSVPDMRMPIQYALTYPERRACPAESLDLSKALRLQMEPPDMERFPALRLGYDVAKRGGTSGAVMNAANEAAVELFRRGDIRFRDIVHYTEEALRRHEFMEAPGLQDLLEADRWARQEVARCTTC